MKKKKLKIYFTYGMIQTRSENFDETNERTSEGCTICVTTPPKAKTKTRIKTKVKTNARA